MRFEEVYDRWTERRLSQQEAADLLNVSERQFRRQHEPGRTPVSIGCFSPRIQPMDATH